MGDFLQQLITLLTEWWEALAPWYVQGDDEVGLVRRLGRYNRRTRPGVNWKWPLVEEVLTASGALESESLNEQTLTTSDGESVTVRAVLSYRVTDPRKYLLDCGDAEGVLNDVVGCAIGSLVPTMTASDLLTADVSDELREACAGKAERWGIEFVDLDFAERTKTRTFRLLQG